MAEREEKTKDKSKKQREREGEMLGVAPRADVGIKPCHFKEFLEC